MFAVFAGLACVDLVHRVDHVPGPDEKVTSRRQELASGGPAANAAKTFAALGGRARLLTALGRGPAADLVRTELWSCGVEVVDVAPDHPDGPPVAAVLVTESTGQRAVVNRESVPLQVVAPLAHHLEGASCLLVDGHHPPLALAAVRAARELGVDVLVDAGRPKPVWDELLPFTDVAICSADFGLAGAEGVPGTVEALRALGVSRVAFTAGSGPILWWDADGSGSVAPPAVRAVDTLGAGDVLHGAFCHHHAAGLPFPDALAAACTLASDRCAHVGLGAWLRTLA